MAQYIYHSHKSQILKVSSQCRAPEVEDLPDTPGLITKARYFTVSNESKNKKSSFIHYNFNENLGDNKRLTSYSFFLQTVDIINAINTYPFKLKYGSNS